jgi:hypothetical protein
MSGAIDNRTVNDPPIVRANRSEAIEPGDELALAIARFGIKESMHRDIGAASVHVIVRDASGKKLGEWMGLRNANERAKT